jgi:DCN1-like protein 1/2
MNNKRKRSNQAEDLPVDFNPSLYPRASRKQSRTASSSASSSEPSESYNYNNNSKMNRRKKSSNNNSTQWGSSSGVNAKAIQEMFDAIAEEDDPDIATMEGISNLADELNIDPLEDIRILVLLHKLGANAKPGQIRRDEWSKGCETLSTDTIEKFKGLLPSLDTGFMVDTEFRDFYKFAFQFNRQGTYRTLPKDDVIVLIEMVLKGRLDPERVSSFIAFLNKTEDTSYNTITLDQWLSFFDFSKECKDLNDYDEENSAWPVLIDDFVDYASSSMQE